MKCEQCEETILYSSIVLTLCGNEFEFCSQDCLEEFIDDNTIIRDVE
jgi:YHS domain-containing protein